MVRKVDRTSASRSAAASKSAKMGTKSVGKVQVGKGSAKASRDLLDASHKAQHVVRKAFNYIKEQRLLKAKKLPMATKAVPSKAEMKKTKKAFKETESSLVSNAPKPRRRAA